MKKVVTKIEYDKVEYEATDGRLFDNEGSCIHHEWQLTQTAVYLVHERGQRSESTEVYSTRELAEAHLPKDKQLNASFSIMKVYIDERPYLIEANKAR